MMGDVTWMIIRYIEGTSGSPDDDEDLHVVDNVDDTIRVWQIFLNIWIYQHIYHKYLFGYLFVSKILIQIYSNIHLR